MSLAEASATDAHEDEYMELYDGRGVENAVEFVSKQIEALLRHS